MTTTTARGPVGRRGRGPALAAALATAALAGAALTGCSTIKSVEKAAHGVEANQQTIDAFTSKMSAAPTTAFQATYVTTGSSPATVVYAVNPPDELAFDDTTSTAGSGGAASGVRLVVNKSGSYACTPPSSGSGGKWACDSTPQATAAIKGGLALYTPAHWIDVLKGLSIAAGIAGDKVTTSSMTVNGFPMSCVNFNTGGQTGKSTICTTSQGLLGYVKSESDSTSFELTHFTTSPSASLFQLPAGAKVTTLTVPTVPSTTAS